MMTAMKTFYLAQSLLFVASVSSFVSKPNAFFSGIRQRSAAPTRLVTVGYRINDREIQYRELESITPDSTHLAPESVFKLVSMPSKQQHGPSNVEFRELNDLPDRGVAARDQASLSLFASMIHGSAAYIATHAGETAVIHIPGELIETGEEFDKLMEDIALSWQLGMKIVIVVGCRSEKIHRCKRSFRHAHECHNSLYATDAKTLRSVEEEAGYVRFEVERKLNRYLRSHGMLPSPTGEGVIPGNVVGGSFYSARAFGKVRGEDYQSTGYASQVHRDGIQQVLDNNDVVLLTTLGTSRFTGDLVNINGNHLAATVAAELHAHKLIYMSNAKLVPTRKDTGSLIQDMALDFSKDLTSYHGVRVHKAGFAIFEEAQTSLPPNAVELLLQMGWASWGVENGVRRAHVVNHTDGALLEELFTAQNGANICIHNEKEPEPQEDELHSRDFDEFFAAAMEQDYQQFQVASYQ